jgi:predicted transcriptional regulator YdeE
MKRKLRAELIGLASSILADDKMTELPQIYEQARKLYEKLAVLNFIEEKLQDLEVDVSKSSVASKFEKMASAVLNENKKVPENNPHDEDIIIPGIDTIKHMVSEMPGGEELEGILAQFLQSNDFVKSDKDTVTPTAEDLAGVRPARSLNDTLTERDISMGLNDRLAFVKHLFNDSTEDFNRILSQLNTMDSHENSLEFIRKMVKPEYENWQGKEEYETRFLAMIERRFS